MKLVLRKADNPGRFHVFVDRKKTGMTVAKGHARGEWDLWHGDEWLFTSTKDGCLKAIWCVCYAIREVTEGGDT